MNRASFDKELVIGRGDVDVASFDLLAMMGMDGGQVTLRLIRSGSSYLRHQGRCTVMNIAAGRSSGKLLLRFSRPSL